MFIVKHIVSEMCREGGNLTIDIKVCNLSVVVAIASRLYSEGKRIIPK
jgi:hypothetical protein